MCRKTHQGLAIRLAGDPPLLRSIRKKLVRNLPAAPLFDTDRTRCNIEAVYARMGKIFEDGVRPHGFHVTDESGVAS